MNDSKIKHTPRCPFPWFGGKAQQRIKNFIMEKMPAHERYIEPFGGGASILLAKKPVQFEVYNDVNRALVNFFKVIADKNLYPLFIERAKMLPNSRALFDEFAKTWTGINDPLEQAIRWFYCQRFSFSGTGYSYGIELAGSKNGSPLQNRYLNSIESLVEVHSRLKKTVIECVDWKDALTMYNGPEWLAYCDPPYAPGSRKSGGYAHELQNKDHEELIQRLLLYKGSVMLSGYNTPLYQPLLDAGWKIFTIDVVCTAAGRTRLSGLQGKGNVLAKQKRTECLWINPLAIQNTQQTF